MVFDESGFWWKWFLMKVVFDESGFWWKWFLMKVVFDENGFWWKWFLMKVDFDENFFDEIDHFHPNFDESVPNPLQTQNFALFFPSPATIFFPLWGSSRGILVVVEALERSNVHVWALWLSCETPAAPPFEITFQRRRIWCPPTPVILAQGHLAGAGGPICFTVVVFRHVGSWAGTANGFLRTASRTPCGRLFWEGFVHPRSGGRSSATSLPLLIRPTRRIRRFSPGATESQCAKSCANPARSNVSLLQARAAAQAKVPRLQASICALGDVDMIEKENLERAIVRAQSQAATNGFHRAEKKRVGCRWGSDRGCPESRRVSRSFGTGERRLEELQLQEKSLFTGPEDAESELVRLTAKAAEFQGKSWTVERERHSSGCHSRVPHRTLSLGERVDPGFLTTVEILRQNNGIESFTVFFWISDLIHTPAWVDEFCLVGEKHFEQT